MSNFSETWLNTLKRTMLNGAIVSPRGMLTQELEQHTVVVDMRKPVLRVPARNLSYKFMAAEAYWILSGDDRVATIAPYNARIANFSDDGVKFFGAYGPKILAQLHYVVDKLRNDRDTRQAGLTIWREVPTLTKDVPCTVAIFFAIRRGELNCYVFMRSSDQWLGLPYDVFNFSMLSHLVCALLNSDRSQGILKPGALYLTAASSHLYESNWSDARGCLNGPHTTQPETPVELYTDVGCLMDTLKALRDTPAGHGLRWWEWEDER